MIISRRQVASHSVAAAAAALHTGSTTSAAAETATPNKNPTDYNDPVGCLFVRQPSARGCGAGPAIDYWSGRVADFDEAAAVPAAFNRVLVYDDLFLRSSYIDSVKSTLTNLPDYFGIDPARHDVRFSFFLEGLNSVGSAVAETLQTPDGSPVADIALLNVDSCGPTAFDWTDLAPSIPGHYRQVVGLDLIAGRGLRDRNHENGYPNAAENLMKRDVLALCGLRLLSSDWLLGLTSLDHYSERTAPCTLLLSALADALAAPDVMQTLTAPNASRTYAIGLMPTAASAHGATLDQQRDVVFEQMIMRDASEPIVFTTKATVPDQTTSIAFWPLQDEGAET